MQGTKRQRRPGVWEVRVLVGRDPKTGAWKQTSKTVHGSARDADAALREMIDSFGPTQVEALGVTVGELLDRWLEECVRLDASPTTLRTYRSNIEKSIRPHLGRIALQRLTARHLDELYGKLKADGRSPKTIRNHHAIVSAALHQAVRWGWMRDNVAERAKPPRVSPGRVNAPPVESVREIIEAAERRDPRIAALLMVAALTGMRRGELCALRWSEVDLERGNLDVSKSVVVVDGGVSVKSTKTDRSRLIALDEVGVAVLLRHRASIKSLAAEAMVELVDDPFVFSPEFDGSLPFRPDTVTSFFIRLRNGLGLSSTRLHDLRHFTATQLIGAGVDVRTVAGRLGHSDPSPTLRTYSHVIEERDRAAAALMGQILQPSPIVDVSGGGEPRPAALGTGAGTRPSPSARKRTGATGGVNTGGRKPGEDGVIRRKPRKTSG
jgi:integrase